MLREKMTKPKKKILIQNTNYRDFRGNVKPNKILSLNDIKKCLKK